jgi:crotonobetainyl-CoA:carnitine CoA-transferase CaiB-like acyl-CoA transferase
MANSSSSAPLAGTRVLELGTFVTGPYAAALLGDLGADVIKIEPPSGDPYRGWSENGYAPYFQAYNKSKRSITLNLRHPDADRIVRSLIEQSDVLIHNYRPGVAERLGIGPESAREINSRLVYCQISGFGPDGPYVERPSYNQVVQSLSGLDSLITDEQHPRPVGPNFGDTLTGLYASHGVLAALLQRERTGEGSVVDISMISSMLAFLSADVQDYFDSGVVPHSGSRPKFSQSYIVRASDGKSLTIHLSSPEKFWDGLLRAIDQPELAADPRFSTWSARVQNYEDLSEHLDGAFRAMPREYWLRALESNDVPSAPLNTVADVLDDPQVRHLGLIRDSPDGHRLVASPARVDGLIPTGAAAPRLGEHTEEILREIDAVDAIAATRAPNKDSE